jgi:hypothetical protein
MTKRFTILSSVFASFIIFIYHGYKMINEHSFSIEKTSEALVITAIMFSYAYYFFLSISADHIFNLDLEEPLLKKISWIIEVAQLVVYFYIWESLKKDNLIPYARVLFIVNLSYVLWDWIHWKENFGKEKILRWIFGIDVIGLVLSAVFLWILSGNLPMDGTFDKPNIQKAISVSLWSQLIILISFLGIFISAIILSKKQPPKEKKLEKALVEESNKV